MSVCIKSYINSFIWIPSITLSLSWLRRFGKPATRLNTVIRFDISDSVTFICCNHLLFENVVLLLFSYIYEIYYLLILNELLYTRIRGLFEKFCYERLSIRKDNVCLTDFVHKYSSFYHTCTCEVSEESSKYHYSYWQLKWPQSYTLAYIWKWKGRKRFNRRR